MSTSQIFSDDFSQRPLWWRDAAPGPGSLDPLPQKCDVLVVGSGYAGLSCAHELAGGGSRVVVVDAEDAEARY